MNYMKKRAITFLEVVVIAILLIFVYMHVVKKMIADMNFSDIKRNAVITVSTINIASKNIKQNGSFENVFQKEEDIIEAFSKEIQTDKVCNSARTEGCWSNNWVFGENDKIGFEMSEGQFVVAKLISSACNSNINIPNTCGSLYIDTNGIKPPNEIGKDMIKLYITAKGLIPAGVKEDIFNPSTECDMVDKYTWGCSARILGVK